MEITYYDPVIIQKKLHQQRLRITEKYMECGTCCYEPPKGDTRDCRRWLGGVSEAGWKEIKCPKCGCYTIHLAVRIKMTVAINRVEEGNMFNGHHIGKYKPRKAVKIIKENL